MNLNGFTNLNNLSCYSNQLTSLNLSGLTSLTSMYCFGNATLSCIQVRDVAAANRAFDWIKDDTASYSANCFLVNPNLYTTIPNANFEQALITLGYDDIIDGHVLTANISGVTALDVSFKNIASLTGIQGFTSLTTLRCTNNPLTSLTLSGLSNLTSLNCDSSQLTSLTLSGLTNLSYLNCRFNQLTSFNPSGLTRLASLDCSYNQLTSLNPSGLTTLTSLYCSHNSIPSLNLSGLTNLVYLFCGGNQLTSLNLNGFTNLTDLSCFGNQLTSLNLSGLTSLQTLFCINNATLSCIQVGNAAAATSNNNWVKDGTASYSANCFLSNPNLYTTIPDANFEQALITLGYDDIIDGHVLTANISGVTDLNVSVKSIASLTGIQGFTSLINLYCSNNQLTSLNLGGLTSLVELNCDSNQLTSLNLSGLTSLTYLNCSFNPTLSCIQVLDVAAANANIYWRKDGTASYSTNCSLILPTSKVKVSQCGATLATLKTQIAATLIPNYQSYRFEITNGSFSRVIVTNKYNFNLTQTDGIRYARTYAIRVAVKVAGVWGAYGVSCNITTPTIFTSSDVPLTNLRTYRTIDCGATLAAMSTPIHANLVYGAEAYLFLIDNGVNMVSFESPIYYFNLTDLVGSTYNTTYTITVAAKIDGVWGNFGPACTVTTPILSASTIPTTKLATSFCGATLPALNTKIGANLVYGASGYRFEITTGGLTTIYDSALYNFRLADAGVVVSNGSTHAIRVAALVYGVYGNYGASCNVTTPRSAAKLKSENMAFRVTAYPNPFNTSFELKVTAPTDETIFVSVFDMLGKQVENREVVASEIENISLGQDYAAGIYNVLVLQGVNIQTIRLIKK